MAKQSMTQPSAASVAYPNASGTATVVDRPSSKKVNVMDYAAKADAVCFGDGAIATGTAVFTSATAGFTSADVGKVMVVNNAKGASVHLYTTISGYTNATTVTLTNNATATVSSAVFTYGTDDTTAWNNAIAALPSRGGTLKPPPSPSLVTTAIAVTVPCAIEGDGMEALFGPFSSSGSVVMPTVPPYLDGSVLVQAGASQDGLDITIVGRSVNLRNFGVRFAGMFGTTGHGIVAQSVSLGAIGYDVGLCGAKWDNVQVFGQDATHYGFKWQNPLNNTFVHLQSYGGGGYWFEQNSNQNPYGNSVLVHPFHCGVSGNSNGFHFPINVVANSYAINLMSLIRPQCISAGPYIGTTFAAWSLSAWGGLDLNMAPSGSGGGAANIHCTAPDFESGNITGSPVLTPGGIVNSVTGQADARPYMYKYNSRRFAQEGSVVLDGLTVESAGSSLWLLKNYPNNSEWSITTDGTERFSVPGTLLMSGKGPGVATAGAALGTSPPPVFNVGTDMGGSFVFGSGSAATTGAVATFTYGRAYGAVADVTVTPNNAATQALGLYVSARSATGFTVSCAVAPSASQAIGIYDATFQVRCNTFGAAKTPVVYTNFSGVDSTTTLGTPQVGSFTVQSGVWGTLSNQGYLVSGPPGFVTFNAAKADVRVDAICDWTTNTTFPLRWSDANHYINFDFQSVYQYNSGFTQVRAWNSTQRFSSGDRMTVIMVGSAITVYKNGQQIDAFTLAFNQTATNFGLRAAAVDSGKFQLFVVS